MSESFRREPFDRGHVVWHGGLFKGSARPWLVVSDDGHPFSGEEYIVVGLTTTARPEAIRVDQDQWVIGGLPKTSYASPWFLTTLKHAGIDRGIGMLTNDTVDAIIDDLVDYVGGAQ